LNYYTFPWNHRRLFNSSAYKKSKGAFIGRKLQH